PSSCAFANAPRPASQMCCADSTMVLPAARADGVAASGAAFLVFSLGLLIVPSFDESDTVAPEWVESGYRPCLEQSVDQRKSVLYIMPDLPGRVLWLRSSGATAVCERREHCPDP